MYCGFSVVTIDTEEDNWGDYKSRKYTIKNIQKLKHLQDIFNTYGIKPTYLITYPVATNDYSIRILKEFLDEGFCEIGTHLHPWNTPPRKEEKNSANSMVCNLPYELQLQKITNLHEIIKKNFGHMPTSFRCGRWGYGSDVSKIIFELGYKVDSSIKPYTDQTIYGGPDYSSISANHFRFQPGNIFKESRDGQMLQLPATVDYLQEYCEYCNKVERIIIKTPLRHFRILGLMRKMRLLNKVYLSPETTSAEDMILLVKNMTKRNHKFFNMFFHSTTLMAGLNSFVRTKEDEKEFLKRIKDYICYIKEIGSIKPVYLSNCYDIVSNILV